MVWNHNTQYFPFIERVARRSGARNAIDVGSGDGMLAARLAEFVPFVEGIDLDPDQVAAAAHQYGDRDGLTFVQGDILRAPLDGELFDLLVCSATIHHLDLQAALTRFRELVAPGGVIVIVGLGRERGIRDWLLSLASVPLNRVMRARRGWYVHGAPTRDADDDFGTIEATLKHLLPGATFRRRLYWRYTAVWNAPRTDRSNSAHD